MYIPIPIVFALKFLNTNDNNNNNNNFKNPDLSELKTSTCARDRRALQQLALNVHVKHSVLTKDSK